MLEKLLVMAKPRSQLPSGISKLYVLLSLAPWRASLPSALQVMFKKRAPGTTWRSSSTAARLSGLSPLRANETSRVGASVSRYSSWCVSNVVVAMARICAGQAAFRVSTTISPT